jgi:hypothetical protein
MINGVCISHRYNEIHKTKYIFIGDLQEFSLWYKSREATESAKNIEQENKQN